MTIVGTVELIAKIDTSQYRKGANEVDRSNKDIVTSTRKADESTESFGSKLTGLAKGGLRIAGASLAALSATIAGMIVGGGISRALNIEDAQAKLKGLGHDTQSIQGIMESALASVKGTAFGLGAAATTAATAVAAGVKPGRDLTKYLTLAADAATIAGTSMEDMGRIFNKVQTVNAAYNDSLLELAEKGIPIYQWLSKEMGVSEQAVKDLASEGKVSSDTFRKAVEDNIAGAALASGNTTRGAWENMLAAMSRLGEKLVNGPINSVREGFGSITKWFDENSQNIVNTVNTIRDTIVGAVTGFLDIFRPVIDYIRNNQQVWQVLKAALTIIAAAIGLVVLAISGGLVLAFGLLFAIVQSGIAIVEGIIQVFMNLIPVISSVIGWVVGLGTVIASTAKAAWESIVYWFGSIGQWFSDRFNEAWNGIKRAFSGVAAFFQGIWNSITGWFREIGTTVGNAIGNALKGVINSVLRGAVGIVNGFVDSINGAIDTINQIPGVKLGKLSRLPIPQLAQGGIITSPTLALVGEGRESEAVIPLSKLDEMINSSGSSGGGDTYNITIHVSGTFATSRAEQRKVAEVIGNRIVEIQQSKAKVPSGGMA